MKKYLMTGMAAIAFCAAFTSCSKDENLYDPKAIEEMEIAQIYENYNQAFIARSVSPLLIRTGALVQQEVLPVLIIVTNRFDFRWNSRSEITINRCGNPTVPI